MYHFTIFCVSENVGSALAIETGVCYNRHSKDFGNEGFYSSSDNPFWKARERKEGRIV